MALRRRVKIALGWLVFKTGVHRAFFRRRALIALFHRVDDAFPDNPISCTRSEFERYCDFFRRHFRVVSLARLLEALQRGEDVSQMLVITFDDGYADNHEVAAVELARRGLPACFFIATEFIESTRVPPWDQELGVRSRWMRWTDVRALADRGFEIGAHTMNHVDLGVVRGDPAKQEITGSGHRLARELGAPPPFFSYPFGRRDQITPENRALVRAAGYACCLSAFGGTVRPGNDPFDLPRVPVSQWFRSPYQFGLETMLARD
jgi:peptidoglycan/xylan/chitin deacetylase (PgdA/CDA1 family)